MDQVSGQYLELKMLYCCLLLQNVLRGERKNLLMSHRFIRDELEIDKSWSKHEAISHLETCFSEKLSSVESSEDGFR